ncbi:MAG: C26 family cysteine hydrolase domain-containing family [Rhodospirillaceae bacterium]|nr:C26 family cysteine hydrolase domain-containing family [Rhodospirillaceae bacterium]MBT4486887.1 C26 family cysteine hydrolase domain-containing family [Rhodospirillaceae bacterium]MBT5195199.1 C26 family cysteine hydrolase domain-containing family [Rhodospirillaceae bacterium]MBT5896806.1 C26 family cysteine hydrolase domain-containing family [Rhodospirillaceae bacterium]MBT6430929.1 C26 family cysteine hydrolase domain-containing family [Rhodospirillaceae bacterium]
MRRIGLTQRVDAVPGRDERRDGLDQRWQSVFADLGALAIPLPNSGAGAETLIDTLDLQGIVLTGGNDVAEAPQAGNVAPERDRLERDLVRICLARALPLLGVCRGMQMINVALGGHLGRTTGHAGAAHPISVSDDGPWPDRWQVNSYHDVCIPRDGLAPGLRCLAVSENGDVEAFRHDDGGCHGIMWHPERELPHRAEDLAFMARALGL